jgi:hypothetical protein
MTYPPQQPGQYGPQDPYGQQQPYGQQPYGQPQYGQPQYGQAPWGQQPGYPGGPPQKNSRTALITTLVIVAVLVIAGGGVAAFLLLRDNSSGGGDGSPRAAADTFTKNLSTALSVKLDNVDLAPLKPVTCADDFKTLDDELKNARKDDSNRNADAKKVTFGVSNFKETSDGATFDMTIRDGTKSDQQPMDVVKEQDHWAVCGLYKDKSGSDEPGTGSSSGSNETSESGSEGGGGNGSIPNPIPKTS